MMFLSFLDESGSEILVNMNKIHSVSEVSEIDASHLRSHFSENVKIENFTALHAEDGGRYIVNESLQSVANRLGCDLGS